MDHAILEKFKTEFSIYDYVDYREYLKALYLFLKQHVKPYSYLRLSDDLGFSKTNVVHLIVTGKRPLSIKASERIVAKLNLNKMEKSYFKHLINFQNARSSEERDKIFQKIIKLKGKVVSEKEAQIQLDFFNEWFHIVIYQMCSTNFPVHDHEVIAKQLLPNIRPEQAKRSLKLLEDLELIFFDEGKKRYLPSQNRIATAEEIASLAIISYHQQMIDLGRSSLLNCSEELREISSVSVSVPVSMVKQLKGEVRLFLNKILTMTENTQSPGEEVYQVNVQLFPTTKIKKDGKKNV